MEMEGETQMEGASIHFPLAREDVLRENCSSGQIASIHFPLAREDARTTAETTEEVASIHFPLAREDPLSSSYSKGFERFNPLPSCEGRRKFHQKLPTLIL